VIRKASRHCSRRRKRAQQNRYNQIMGKLNECEHKWRPNALWAVAYHKDPRLAKNDPGGPDVGYVPLEYCIDCGVVRLPEKYHGHANISY
jgi:hypothetical protein